MVNIANDHSCASRIPAGTTRSPLVAGRDVIRCLPAHDGAGEHPASAPASTPHAGTCPAAATRSPLTGIRPALGSIFLWVVLPLVRRGPRLG
jgi:hypothetical protein